MPYRLAILFPAEEDKPKFQWIELKSPRLETKVAGPRDVEARFFIEAMHSDLFGGNSARLDEIPIYHNPNSGFCLAHKIAATKVRDASSLPMNKCIENLKSSPHDLWRGPILLTRRFVGPTATIPDPPSTDKIKFHSNPVEVYEDITLGDMRHGIDLIRTWPDAQGLRGQCGCAAVPTYRAHERAASTEDMDEDVSWQEYTSATDNNLVNDPICEMDGEMTEPPLLKMMREQATLG